MAGSQYDSDIVDKLAIAEDRIAALETAVFGAVHAKVASDEGGTLTGVSLA